MANYSWSIIDPILAEPANAAVAQRILDLVHSNWTADVQFDLDEAVTRALLDKHRISTLIPSGLFPEHQQEEYHQRLIDINGTQLRIEAIAAEVLSLLADASIDCRLLKGNASAYLDYPEPSFRQTGDVDLLVRPDDFDQCVAILRANDFGDYSKISKTGHRLKGTTVVAPTGIEVDLHTRLFTRSEYRDLFGHDRADLDGFEGSGLSAEDRLVHAAGHLMLSRPGYRRISGLADITAIRDRHAVDIDQTLARAHQLGVGGLVGAALELEASLCRRRADINRTWPSPDWIDRATLVVPNRRLIPEYLARFREVPKADRASYLRAWLSPSKREWRYLRQNLRRRR